MTSGTRAPVVEGRGHSRPALFSGPLKPPPLLIGLALLLWGWEAELVWVGIVAALALEAPRVLATRWQFSQADLDRIWNLCVALFLGATIYAFASSDNLSAVNDLLRENSMSSRIATINQSKRSLFQLLQWLPLMFLPIALAQAYSQDETMNLSTFSWWLRRRRSDPAIQARYLGFRVNVAYPFFGCCLFAASAGNRKGFWFAAALVGLVGWALWQYRPRTFSLAGWAASFLVALGLGVGVQFAMLELQRLVQRLDEALVAQWSGSRSFNATENQTRIGAIGRLKPSGRIVLRVEAKGEAPPALLRQASYNLFKSQIWMVSKRDFENVTAEANQAGWLFHNSTGATRVATISGYLRGGSGLLALPHGVVRLENLPALGVATNWFGCVRVDDGPGFVQVQTSYRPDEPSDSSPLGREDKEVPLQELGPLHQIIDQLNLRALEPDMAVRAVQRFFAEHFTYSLWQGEEHQASATRTALGRFLIENRSGHCEYFATATVLLLRAAGIPARYATGFCVQEKEGRYFVVRERHAHAWCLAWVDGAWRDVDTTPGTWISVEASRASRWQGVNDFFSWIWFEFSRWRWGHAEWKRYLLWLIVPLLLFAFGKLLLQKQWRRTGASPAPNPLEGTQLGLDSEFFSVEQRLAAAGFARQPGETGFAWLERVADSGVVPATDLHPLLRFHYRLRFDPLGVSAGERSWFRSAVQAWLARHEAGLGGPANSRAPEGQFVEGSK